MVAAIEQYVRLQLQLNLLLELPSTLIFVLLEETQKENTVQKFRTYWHGGIVSYLLIDKIIF